MRDISPTPNIAVTIGGQLRVYYAYVTTAGPELDGPTTMTLYASTLTELSGFALDPIVHDRVRGKALARLVLIDLQRTRPGIAPDIDGSSASAHRQIRCSSVSKHFSTGCGNACRRPTPVEVHA